MDVALIGSVSSSWYALDALLRSGVEVTAALGVDESRRTHISDYRSLRALARGAGVPFRSFVKVSDPDVESFLHDHEPDLLWVIGLSQLVPNRLIDVPRVGGVGFHPTMLPEGRGRAPVAWTILRNARAAVSLFFLTDEPDAGDIIVQREVPVLADDYAEDLIRRTNLVLADVVGELAPSIRTGALPRHPQDHAKASYYEKRIPEDGLIDWSMPTEGVYRLVRACGRPYPGAFTRWRGRKLTVWRGQPAEVAEGCDGGDAGRLMKIDEHDGLLVATGDGGFWMTETAVGGAPAPQTMELGERFI